MLCSKTYNARAPNTSKDPLRRCLDPKKQTQIKQSQKVFGAVRT